VKAAGPWPGSFAGIPPVVPFIHIDSVEVGEKDKEAARQQVKINWRI